MTINSEVEILAVLRTVEEMTLTLYHMAQGVYGGLGQFGYMGTDAVWLKGLVEDSQDDLQKAGELLSRTHDRIAREIEERRGKVKELLTNERSPGKVPGLGPNPYL